MTLHIWRILCTVSAGLFVAGVIALLATRILKNKFYHEFHEDELVKTVRATNSKNSIYIPSGETSKFIKKYVICKTVFDRFLICNFARPFEEISFYVVQYTGRKKPSQVLKVTQRATDDTSRVITLARNCRYVNILINEADGLEINKNAIRPLSMTRIHIHGAIKSLMLFLSLFVVRHVIIELFGGIYTLQYLDSILNYAIIAGSFVLSLLFYLIDIGCFRRKNNKQLNGGAIEYEFV